MVKCPTHPDLRPEHILYEKDYREIQGNVFCLDCFNRIFGDDRDG